MADSGYNLVATRIRANEYLKPQDRSVVQRICNALSLDGPSELVDIDTKWKSQMDIEADIIYLLGQYGDMLVRYEGMLDRIEAARILSIPDRDDNERKHTVDSRSAVVSIDADIQKVRSKCNAVRSINKDFDRLSKIVFGRNQKLEKLSVNYRTEAAVDSKQ